MRQPRAKYLELSQRLLFSDNIIHIKIAKNREKIVFKDQALGA